jgi:hypothetical protein
MYKDDIESMALFLISLALECKLPWADAKSDAEVKTKMEKCDIVSLASTCGLTEVGEIVMMCRSLKQDQSPDYDSIKSKLVTIRDRKVASGTTKTTKAGGGSEKKTSKKTENAKKTKANEREEENVVDDKVQLNYPTLYDENFNKKIYQKYEFYKNKIPPQTPESKLGNTHEIFKLSNSQKFLKNFISPQTPYRSLLIFHGLCLNKLSSL